MAHGMEYKGSKNIASFQSKIKAIIKDFDYIVIQLQKLTKKWKLKEKPGKPYPKYNDAKIQITANDQNMLTKEVQILVFGCTNAGKSALINTIMEKEILPSHEGSTTNCFTEVHKSTDNSSYIIFPGNSTKKPLSQIKLVDETANNEDRNIPFGASVKIYISKAEYPKLTENIIIIDSPGIDGYKNLDKHLTEQCRISNILILVINSVGNFSQVRKEFLKSFQTQFSELKIIVVINQWDKIAEKNKEYYKKKHTKETNECLRETTGVNKNYDIFFLSATEQLNIIQHESNNLTINSNEERRQSFNDFLKCLQDNIEEQSKICLKKLETNLKILMSTFDELQQCRKDMEVKLHNQIKTELSCFNKSLDLNKTIKEHLNYIFDDGYELYFSKGLKSFKAKPVHASTSNMEIYLKEFMIVIVESLKILIGDSIREAKKEDSVILIQILETFYYPFVYDILRKMQIIQIKELNAMFSEIAKDIKIWRGCAIAGGVVAGLPLAAAGIVAGILLPVSTAIAAPTLGAAAATVGGGSTGIASMFATKVRIFKRNQSKMFYKAKEERITMWWLNRKEKLEKSYEEFISSLDRLVKIEFSELNKGESKIKKQLDYLQNKC